MELRFSWRALDDMSRLRAFIAKENPPAARRISAGLRHSIQRLIDQPKMGRLLEYPLGVRQWVHGPYVVHYIVENDILLVLRVWHGRERQADD